MFCSKCGAMLQDGSQFCPSCGNKVGEVPTPIVPQEVKVMLDPAEVVPAKETADSSKSFSGQGKTIGLILIIISIILDLVALVSGFIPIMTVGTILFVVGILMRIFMP